MNAGTESLIETRHYYVNVEKCMLDFMIRPAGVTYQSGIGKSTKIKNWSMRYTKSRRRLPVRCPHHSNTHAFTEQKSSFFRMSTSYTCTPDALYALSQTKRHEKADTDTHTGTGTDTDTDIDNRHRYTHVTYR